MNRKLIIILIMFSLFLIACSSKEQKIYEELLEQAKEKIIEEEFNIAYNLLIEVIETSYEDNEEAIVLHNQLKQYRKLEDLLNDGKFKDIYKVVQSILKEKNGSSIIKEKAKEFERSVRKKEEIYEELTKMVDDALELVDDKKYTEANKRLKEIELTDYEASYYESIKKTITNTIASNDEQLKKIEQQNKEKAEKKAQEEAERKSNMLKWSDKEVEQYMVNFFGMEKDHLLIEIYDRTNTSFRIEVRQHNAAMGMGDPNVAPALGFFEVRNDGKLYEMDRISGDYKQVN